jgi:hypothetical protein
MKKIIFCILVFFFIGCHQPPVWIKKDVTQDQIDRDRIECEDESRSTIESYSKIVENDTRVSTLIHSCMMLKGYHKKR